MKKYLGAFRKTTKESEADYVGQTISVKSPAVRAEMTLKAVHRR